MATACTAFWHGATLGPIERACIRSLLRHGHALTLYSYREVQGVPAGVTLADAASILPERCLFLHYRSGSAAPFADWFRYALQAQGAGAWVDLDLYFVGALDAVKPMMFGWQEPAVINNAVLRLPPDSALLLSLLELFEGRGSLPWLSPRETLADWWIRRTAPAQRLGKLPWGATGPRALSALAKRLGVAGQAEPPEVFYPVAWQRADWIADPAISLDDITTPRTVAVHLWNDRIAHLKRAVPPAGSFLARLIEEGAP